MSLTTTLEPSVWRAFAFSNGLAHNHALARLRAVPAVDPGEVAPGAAEHRLAPAVVGAQDIGARPAPEVVRAVSADENVVCA